MKIDAGIGKRARLRRETVFCGGPVSAPGGERGALQAGAFGISCAAGRPCLLTRHLLLTLMKAFVKKITFFGLPPSG
ncbi:hypothetical protein TRIP_B210050 [uncultured Desulfatiglans sp.]|uniref:Uncharacterized protein n=1 Tax=Uncultured Desulfatiglans sp. TaxID=1748965 RepID=A0A653A455_UNCDX|nr:hypothetical protein TRIP_B210050 [uncultured Desulfatiglans sp.]